MLWRMDWEPRWSLTHWMLTISGSEDVALGRKKSADGFAMSWIAQAWTKRVVEKAKQAWQFLGVRLAI